MPIVLIGSIYAFIIDDNSNFIPHIIPISFFSTFIDALPH